MFNGFFGEYNHTIDTKGRVIVPAKFRETLGEQFVLSRGLDGCLWVYPTEEWSKFAEKLSTLPTIDKDSRSFTRFFLAGATQCEFDRQGRILIPAGLRTFAKLQKDVVLTGMNTRIEVWSAEKWQEENDSFNDNMDDIAARMVNLGITF